MAYISLDETLPGMRSLLTFHPIIAPPLLALMQTLMRSDEGLSKGERELIATFVSELNACTLCSLIHGEVAQCLLGEKDLVKKVKDDYQNAPITDKLKTLLTIAESVQKNGKQVNETQIKNAKSLGASDLEIHDTVLITALFCLFNRYLDGLGVKYKDTPETLQTRAELIAEMGYAH